MGGGYQSQFLKDKLEEQKSKKRLDRKNKDKPLSTAITGTKPRARGGAAQGDEQLLEIIEELQND